MLNLRQEEGKNRNLLRILNDILIRTIPTEVIYKTEYNLEELLPACKMGIFPEFTEYDETKFKNVLNLIPKN